MASSSTTWVQKSFKYDVFLSFRGEDTRTRFVSHLYEALTKSGITTYKDDKNLDKGKKIGKELIEAIEESRFHLIIFSKNYASSSWCLDELLKIMKCHKTQTGHTVYPIFYDVEPTEVRKQTGAFEEDFKKHENNVAVGKWREALKEVADLSGWELKKIANGHEADFIKEIVKNVSLKSPSISADSGLVGMRTRINDVISSLKAFPNEVCMIGILGMGGIGKTTLARAVFDLIRNEFEGSSFVANVREVSGPNRLGLNKLQQQMLRDVSNDQTIKVNNVLDGKVKIKEKLSCEKVLVVLDDVDHIDQLNALAGELNWFKKGSRIIVTTRNVLASRKFKSIHDMKLLPNEDAICLLSSHAFGTKTPIQGYEKLVQQVLHYASGLPLVLTTLGSLLYDAEEDVWIDTLAKLQKVPLDEIVQKLEISYASLDDDCKGIFLDIACILKYWKQDKAIIALKSRGFNAICGLDVLKKKSLITINEDCLWMHDHIQDMGRNIIRRNLEPNKHTRLWIANEIEDILANNSGTNKTTCLTLHPSPGKKYVMNGLGKMNNLRFLYVNPHYSLIFDNLDQYLSNSLQCLGDRYTLIGQYLPNSLQYLRWDRYPCNSLPKTFQASNLVALDMSEAKIEKLWKDEETKVVGKLRFLRLNFAKNLKTLNLLHAPNIEELDLRSCYNLVTLYMPRECRQLKSLYIYDTKLEHLHLRKAPNLKALYLEKCSHLVELNLLECPSLISLMMLRLSVLKNFKLYQTHNLEKLIFDTCPELELLSIPRECPKLKTVNIKFLKLTSLDLRLAPNIKTLNLRGCYNLAELCMHDQCQELKVLNLECIELMSTFDFRLTPNLEQLTVDGYGDTTTHLFSVGWLKLKSLKHFDSMLMILELIPDNKYLLGSKSSITYLCKMDVNLKIVLNIDEDPDDLPSLCLHSYLVDVCPLHPDNKSPMFELRGSYRERPPSIKNIEKLISAGYKCSCVDPQRFFGIICGLQSLRNLSLFGDFPEAFMDLDRLQFLERLYFWFLDIKFLPDSICKLKHLKNLKVSCSNLLEKLPENLGQLQCLEELNVQGCKVLCDIPNSICRMERLKYISLSGCEKIKRLPRGLGHLECLEKLNVHGTSINYLPLSILSMKKKLEICGSDELMAYVIKCLPESKTEVEGNIAFINYRNRKPHENYEEGQGEESNLDFGFHLG